MEYKAKATRTKSYTVDEARKALEHYCAYQDRCHAEVEKKLETMNLIAEAKEIIIIHLIQHKFLNEERFSKSFARGKFRIKKWGKQRIIRELKFRKISDYNVKIALKEIDKEEYIKTAYDLATKKIMEISIGNYYQKRKKIFGYLYRRGYELDLINRILTDCMK